MAESDFNPVNSLSSLRRRIGHLLNDDLQRRGNNIQFELPLANTELRTRINAPSEKISEFLNLITNSVPDGDVYLFGGVLRDIALHGQKGFNSDIDLVVEGDVKRLLKYIVNIGAKINKFGGYRINIGYTPVDIWRAEDTWAIKQGLVEYNGIFSLTNTTILNWDGILMNWRTKSFIHKSDYFEKLNNRILDIVLEENPNPLGAAVRVFRHISQKDPNKISIKAIKYLASNARKYDYDALRSYELKSYKNTHIRERVVQFFSELDATNISAIRSQFMEARDIVEPRLLN